MNSRNILITAIATLVLIIGMGAFSIFLLISSNQKNTPIINQAGTLTPSQSNTTAGSFPTTTNGQGMTSGDTLEVRTAEGSMFVSDFTKGADVATTSDNYSYISYPRETTSATYDSIQYQIFFFPFDKSFLISILKEPIGEIRAEATEDLMKRLGISHEELCTLVAEVTIPRDVNDYYTGMSLGFPGCPGATKFAGDANL